jgi:hypothetical protein
MCLHFLADGHILSGGGDGRVVLWHVAVRRTIAPGAVSHHLHRAGLRRIAAWMSLQEPDPNLPNAATLMTSERQDSAVLALRVEEGDEQAEGSPEGVGGGVRVEAACADGSVHFFDFPSPLLGPGTPHPVPQGTTPATLSATRDEASPPPSGGRAAPPALVPAAVSQFLRPQPKTLAAALGSGEMVRDTIDRTCVASMRKTRDCRYRSSRSATACVAGGGSQGSRWSARRKSEGPRRRRAAPTASGTASSWAPSPRVLLSTSLASRPPEHLPHLASS